MSKTGRFLLALSIVPQVLIVRILSHYPETVEAYYSCGLYPILSKIFRFIFGWMPISFGDILIGFAIIYIIRWGIVSFKYWFKNPISILTKILSTLSLVYFMFHLLWGLNYYRLPLHDRLGIDTEYSTEDLEYISEQLISSTNKLHLKITKDSSAVVDISYDFKTLKNKISNAYNLCSKKYSFLKYNPSSQKQSLLSLPQAYMGFSGYLNPLTNEAQVNHYTPNNSMPITLAHEQAHQLGYAAENEANFLAFFTTEENPDPAIRYAALTFALRHCLNDLFKQNPDSFNRIKKTINPGILDDFKARQQQWEQFKNPLEPYFKSGYNTYLKANRQREGIKSYSRVVGLIINYLKNNQSQKKHYNSY